MTRFAPLSQAPLRIAFCILAAVAPAAAGTIAGVVHNGTTGAVVARQDVVLIQLQGGMQPVETVQTDAQGRYTFNRPDIGQAPMLVRVVFRGVNYHQNVPPGVSTADVEVFDPTAPAASLSLVNHAIIVRPDGATLTVGEEFSIHNLSKPPATYFTNESTFEFSIPDGATLREVSAAGPAGMPLTQGAIDKGKNRYGVAFPLKPGENTIRVSYNLDYAGNQATLKIVAPLAAGRVVLAGPAGVQVASEGFAPAGNEQGYTFYSRDGVAANTPVVVTVSGAAPPLAANAGGVARDSGAPGPGAGSALDSANVAVISPRVASVQWILIAGFSMLFALGVFYLWRQPRAGAARIASPGADIPLAAANERAALAASAGEGKLHAKHYRAEFRATVRDAAPPSVAPHAPSVSVAPGPPARSPVTSPATPAPQAAAVSAADVHRDVRLSLDELKDTLFRLELRHQAGTISDDDYAQERSRLEAILRNLVRG
jgi:hypothetical protein